MASEDCQMCGFVTLSPMTCNFCQKTYCTTHLPKHFQRVHQQQVDHYRLTVGTLKDKKRSILYRA